VAEELRGWGTLPPDAFDRIVVLSPHLDDAVLGCGNLLAAHPGARVITVFAGAPPTYPDPMTWWDRLSGFTTGDDPLAVRRAEDAGALGELGATRSGSTSSSTSTWTVTTASGPTRSSTGWRRR
jgi:LmbE family N-acetylglucosaminyl deacetylase